MLKSKNRVIDENMATLTHNSNDLERENNTLKHNSERHPVFADHERP